MRASAENRMKGTARQIKGKVKQETGRLTRNRSVQAEGFVEKNVGKAQKALGNVQKRNEKSR